jgi:hypothetical protein
MSEKVLSELVSSVREAGAIMRGEVEPSRVFEHPSPRRSRRHNPESVGYAICIETDDPELLVPRKLYRVTLAGEDYVQVRDEAGETAIYPASCFIFLQLSRDVQRVLERVA